MTLRAWIPPRSIYQELTYFDSAYACAEDADALVIATEWEQFRALDLARLKKVMACPVVIDLRNIYRPSEMAELGFLYESVGRAPVGRGTDTRFDSHHMYRQAAASQPTKTLID